MGAYALLASSSNPSFGLGCGVVSCTVMAEISYALIQNRKGEDQLERMLVKLIPSPIAHSV